MLINMWMSLMLIKKQKTVNPITAKLVKKLLEIGCLQGDIKRHLEENIL